MDSLYDLLAGKDFDTPPEVLAIKDYVRKHYQTEVEVQLRDRDILVKVPGASLASRLRFDMPKIQKLAATDKRIVLRIN
jgi:hypothetical protein